MPPLTEETFQAELETVRYQDSQKLLAYLRHQQATYMELQLNTFSTPPFDTLSPDDVDQAKTLKHEDIIRDAVFLDVLENLEKRRRMP